MRSRGASSSGGWPCSGALPSWCCECRPARGCSRRPEKFVESILNCALAGARFVFGKALVDAQGPAGFVFAFRVLPTVIFVAALFAVLYHLGVMQWVVRGFAVVMAKLMGTSGAESLERRRVALPGPDRGPAHDSPVPRPVDPVRAVDRDDLGNGTRFRRGHGRLHQLRDRGAAHPDGRDHDGPRSDLALQDPGPRNRASPRRSARCGKAEGAADANVLDAAARGTRDGLHLALNIAAMLISFLALVELVNLGLGYLGTSLQRIVGWVMAPVAYMLGVAWEDCKGVGKLLGTRTVLNELIAYSDLGEMKETAS